MRTIAAIFLLSLPSFAQQNAQKPVATINGEVVTAQALDQMYDRMDAQTHAQYEKAGGKAAFLDNYVKKRLLVQEALKSGFDKRPEIQTEINAAKENAIFDAYVRDVIGGAVVKETDVRAYYDAHPQDFATPERVHVRHIVITASSSGPHSRTKEQALDVIKDIAVQLRERNFAARAITDPQAAARLRVNQFAQLARQYSEDGSAPSGGDLGFVEKGQLDPDFEAAAWALPVGVPSGIVETKYGYHLILVEAKQPPGVAPYDEVKSMIRNVLLNQQMGQVMSEVNRLTNELRANSKIAVYPENIR
jgi:peptidyl-prolyl cis-trans isomerase C